eukprot:Nitzschia sp. Nitz4//scaffold17_size182527//106978//108597//NITZ4_001863-RA/size182527-processed-gene-0.21-mRNA-1//1//CDS//3329539367//2935//frame0
MVVGELQLIATQVAVDVIYVLGFGFCTFGETGKWNTFCLLATAAVTLALSGEVTNRWTIIFPMVPILLLQAVRRMTSRKWLRAIIFVVTLFLIALAVALAMLFPAVQLPLSAIQDAPYNVGVVDIYMPVSFQLESHTMTMYDDDHPDKPQPNSCPAGQDHVTVRILYPTLDEVDPIPHFMPETVDIICEETMALGPDALRPFAWMLHPWRLSSLDAKRHANILPSHSFSQKQQCSSLPTEAPFPVVFFSHGLGGNANMYSYQTMALAANGYIVVAIDHTDGSAPIVPRKDGSFLRRFDDIVKGDWPVRRARYTNSRRVMTEYRAEEFLAMVDGFLALNQDNIPELEDYGLSFVGKLDTSDIHYMGHSFGGATALHASRIRPPTAVVALEPATEWIPDPSRNTMFAPERLVDCAVNYTYWAVNATDNLSTSVHDQDLLILFSTEWDRKLWGGVDVLMDMYQRGMIGPKGGSSKVGVIADAYHSEFSDICMLTPPWLARMIGLTGARNPLETAKEIHDIALSFLTDVRSRRSQCVSTEQSE